MKIDQETIAILDACTTAPRVVVLPPGQLPRALYDKVDKVLRAAGGKWNRKTKAHEFTDDATDIIEQAILTGEVGNPKQELGVFYTPAQIARKAAGMLRLDRTGLTLLEPSAGMGALAIAARDAATLDIGTGSALDITCLDILPKHVVALKALGFECSAVADFLKERCGALEQYDRILMNPPFARQDDARHFLHALGFLKPGGRIVAIMSPAVTFRDTELYREMRALPGGLQIEHLPAGSFKESGTMVNTVIVVYDKPL